MKINFTYVQLWSKDGITDIVALRHLAHFHLWSEISDRQQLRLNKEDSEKDKHANMFFFRIYKTSK